MAGGVTDSFPLHALLLVSENNRAAHDVFRTFRSRFEELGAGFQHLVIFGQHGVSQAEKTLLTRLGLAAEDIPSLVLLTASNTPMVYTLPLLSGDVWTGRRRETGSWGPDPGALASGIGAGRNDGG